MTTGSTDNTEREGNWEVTRRYTVNSSGFGFTYIDANSGIRDRFNFLTNEMPNKLDSVQNYLNSALQRKAFEFNETKDVNEAVTELTKDINNLKSSLGDLRQSFMTAIDNVNAELEYNFGWIIIAHKREVVVKREEIPSESNG